MGFPLFFERRHCKMSKVKNFFERRARKSDRKNIESEIDADRASIVLYKNEKETTRKNKEHHMKRSNIHHQAAKKHMKRKDMGGWKTEMNLKKQELKIVEGFDNQMTRLGSQIKALEKEIATKQRMLTALKVEDTRRKTMDPEKRAQMEDRLKELEGNMLDNAQEGWDNYGNPIDDPDAVMSNDEMQAEFDA